MKAIARILLLLPACFLLGQFSLLAQVYQGQSEIDSLHRIILTAKDDTNKAKLLYTLSYQYHLSNPDSGISIGNKALALSQKLNWKFGMGKSYNIIGINYGFGKSNQDVAIDYYLKSKAIMEEIGFRKGIASAYANISVAYSDQSKHDKALEYQLKALKINEEIGNKAGIATNLGNISVTYSALSEHKKALEYRFRALKIEEENNDSLGIALHYTGIGVNYSDLGDNDKALEYYFKALKIYEKTGTLTGISQNLGNIAIVYKEQKKFPEAREYYFKSLQLDKEIGNKSSISIQYGNIAVFYKNIATTSGENEQAFLNNNFAGNKQAAIKTAKLYTDSAIAIQKEIGYLQGLIVNYEVLSNIQNLLGDYPAALESYKVFTLYKDSVFNMEKDKKITQAAMQYEFDKKEATTKAEQEKKDIRQRNVRNSITAGLAGVLIFSVVVFRQRNKIAKEKKRSEELLLNILPAEVAEELKAKGSADAKLIDEVTVLFTDFKGFTAMSEKVSPKELVKDLNECFSAFDRIMEKNGMEKIKTIGDAYMAAGGLPTPNKTHAADAINAALEMRAFIAEGKARKLAAGAPYFEIRIGIHTGPVVAGIVGVKKFQYDIWGDTVNTASRMESSGEVSKVNISETTYNLVKEQFNCEYRGEIEAKGKGKVKMYFVEV